MKNFKNFVVLSSSIGVLLGGALLVNLAFAQSEKGQEMADQHTSAVAKVVQGLTTVAGKDRNIGTEVKEVAKEQAEQQVDAIEAINNIENRPAFLTFLIGTDYKSVGVLRSQMVITANHIERLTKALARATSQQVKDDLQDQIDALQDIQVKINDFVRENENKLSLLGWVVKFLSQ